MEIVESERGNIFEEPEKPETSVEVKASANRRSKSMASALANHGAQRGVRLSTNNIGEQGNILTVPLYLAFLFAQDVAAQGGSEGLEPVSLEGLEL